MVNQGNPAAAISILERVLSIQESNLGTNSTDLLQTLDLLSQLLRGKADFGGSVAMLRRMLTVQFAAYGQDDLRIAPVYNSLGLVLHQNSSLEESIYAFRRSVEIRE